MVFFYLKSRDYELWYVGPLSDLDGYDCPNRIVIFDLGPFFGSRTLISPARSACVIARFLFGRRPNVLVACCPGAKRFCYCQPQASSNSAEDRKFRSPYVSCLSSGRLCYCPPQGDLIRPKAEHFARRSYCQPHAGFHLAEGRTFCSSETSCL